MKCIINIVIWRKILLADCQSWQIFYFQTKQFFTKKVKNIRKPLIFGLDRVDTLIHEEFMRNHLLEPVSKQLVKRTCHMKYKHRHLHPPPSLRPWLISQNSSGAVCRMFSFL